jgi:osmotically-inducible protein OsmY
VDADVGISRRAIHEEGAMDRWDYGSLAVEGGQLEQNPLPETLADAERLVASIERAVSRETCGGVRNLRVELSHEGILLTGRCSSYYTKQKAQHAAMGVSGSEELTNCIEVV